MVPVTPRRAYSQEFRGLGDWLGTGNIHSREWRPFEEARAFVQALKFKNEGEWRAYCKSSNKPDDIPTNPSSVYGQEFQGLGDWLGTGNIRNREWRPFEEARAHIRALGFKNQDAWRRYARSGERPDDIPTNPERVYHSLWVGMGD